MLAAQRLGMGIIKVLTVLLLLSIQFFSGINELHFKIYSGRTEFNRTVILNCNNIL